MRMTQVATNLLGRYAKGYFRKKNPDYVKPDDEWGYYSSKQKKTLTNRQMTEEFYYDVTEEVVAVTTEGTGNYAELVIWGLRDGKTTIIEKATVMPAGWQPELR